MKENHSITVHMVKGHSMYPYLQERDYLLVEENLVFKLGDLILFEKENESYVHRYLGENLYKGDNLKRFDQEYGLPIIPKGRVISRFVGDKKAPILFNRTTFLLCYFSKLNHANIRIMHRAAALMTRFLCQINRSREFGNE